MKILEQVKKEKNYLAHIKGYPIDPEGFPLWFLFERLNDEYVNELLELINPENIMVGTKEEIMNELGDLSNIIDYIATKLILDYPDIHEPQQQGER